MTDHIDPPHGEDPATQKWLDGRVMEAHQLSDEDRAAVTGLPAGAAMLVGIGGQTAGARYVLRGRPSPWAGPRTPTCSSPPPASPDGTPG